MKTDPKIKSIIEFAFEALKITISYIEHNKKNPTKKEFHKFNELLLNNLEKCYYSTYFNTLNVINVINLEEKK